MLEKFSIFAGELSKKRKYMFYDDGDNTDGDIQKDT